MKITAEQWSDIVSLAERASYCAQFRSGKPATLHDTNVCQHVVCDLVRHVLIVDQQIKAKL